MHTHLCLVDRVIGGWPSSRWSFSTSCRPCSCLNVDENEITRPERVRIGTFSNHLRALPLPARQSHQHPQATSSSPDTHCAPSTPSAHSSLHLPDGSPCLPTGLFNFNLLAVELYVGVDHHPGGFRYLRFNGFRMIFGVLHVSVICIHAFCEQLL